MKLNTVYAICMAVTLSMIFVASFIVGNALKETSYNIEPPKESNLKPETKQAEISQQPPSADSTEVTSQQTVIQDPELRYYDIALSDKEQEHIFRLCEEYGIPPELVFAVIDSESSYNGTQISENGDWGIMQINAINHPELEEKLGVTDFLDFEQNTLCGIYMLSEYYYKYADISKIVMCYRYGEKRARQMWDDGVFDTEYTREIILTMATLKYR